MRYKSLGPNKKGLVNVVGAEQSDHNNYKYFSMGMDLKSNEPFWLVKNGILASYPSLHEPISCDVLIVGAGITGSLIAHQCVAEGLDTVIIDRREVCNGSTSATTSMLQYE